MNNLSIMIYLAEVSEKMSVVFGCAALLGAIGIAVVALVSAMAAGEGLSPGGSWKKPLKYIPVVFLLAVLNAALPSSRAIYMIAASEAGETIVTNPEAKEMLGDLKEIIRRKLKGELSEIEGTSK